LETIEVEQGDRIRPVAAIPGQEAPELLLQREAVRQPSELIVMRKPLQLRLRALAVGDVLIGARYAADAAVGVVHARGSGTDVDQRTVLAHTLHLHIADRLASQRTLEQGHRFASSTRRNQVDAFP